MKYEMLALAVAALSASACATAGVTSREAISKIELGMSRAEVIELLGQPGKRSFMGTREVLQYCQTGYGADSYTAIWLTDGVVTGLGQDDLRLGVDFSCAEQYPRIDWGDD